MSDIMPLTMIVMGVNDHLRCGVGWHDRAYDERNGVCFRWTGARADFCLEVPRRASALRFMVSGPALLTGRPVPLSLYAPGRLLCHLPAAAPSDFWTIAEMTLKTLELAEDNAPAQFTIRCETFPGTRALSAPFVPDRYLRNSDFRRLGIMVAAIRVV